MSEQTQLDRIEQRVQKIDKLLTGNGDPSKGIIVRLDRLEQTEIKRSRLVGALFLGVLLMVATTIWGKLTSKPPVNVETVTVETDAP